VTLSADARRRRTEDLARVLAASLHGAADFHALVYQLVERLRAVGHDIWSFDETDELQRWAARGTPQRPGLVVVFRPEHVDVEWVE
jgi:hypothetical protein